MMYLNLEMMRLKLSDKISAIVFSGFISLVIVMLISSKTIFLSGFEDVEDMNIVDSISRLEDDFNYEIRYLDSINLDYSSWDDTYEFLKDKNQSYIDSNFSEVTISENFRIDFCVISDMRGNIEFKAGYDPQTGKEIAFDDDIAKLVKDEQLTKDVVRKMEPLTGMVKISDKLLMVSIRPVLKGDGEGPSAGMMMGRIFDEKEIQRLSDKTYLNLKMRDYGEFEKIKGTQRIATTVVKREGGVIKSYLLIDIINSMEKLTIEISNPTKIYSMGNRLLNQYVYLIITVGIVFALISSRIFENTITARITALDRFMSRAELSSGRESRAKITGNDEISRLGYSINFMLERLEGSHKRAVEEEKRYRLLFENMSEGFAYSKAIRDENEDRIIDFELVDANVEFCNIAANGDCDIAGKGLRFTEIEGLSGAVQNLADEASRILVSGEVDKKHETQLKIDNIWYSTIIYSTGSDFFGMMFWDITSMKERETSIMEMARKDHLTELPNRKYLQEYIETLSKDSLSTKEEFAVMFLDVDNFKAINDNCGHSYGDEVLRRIAKRIRASVRKDDFVARLGGDEFVIVLSNLDVKNNPFVLSKRIQRGVKEEFECEKKASGISVSIGTSVFPADGENIDELMENADRQMYSAKKMNKENG